MARKQRRRRKPDTHGLTARSGSAAASMARPGPGRGQAPGRRPSNATLSLISLGTRRDIPSHHLDDTTLRPRRYNTRINTPRMVFCYIGWLFFEKSIYIFPELDRTSRCPAQVMCVKFASFFSAPVLPTFFWPFFVQCCDFFYWFVMHFGLVPKSWVFHNTRMREQWRPKR